MKTKRRKDLKRGYSQKRRTLWKSRESECVAS